MAILAKRKNGTRENPKGGEGGGGERVKLNKHGGRHNKYLMKLVCRRVGN